MVEEGTQQEELEGSEEKEVVVQRQRMRTKINRKGSA